MKKKYKDVYYDVPDVKTIKELVIHGVGEGKDQPLFMYDNVNGTKDNPFITKTFNDVWHDINCLGTYMFAHGVKDCNVAIIGENSYEWIIAFFANLLGKIVSVPLDPKLPAEDLAVQLNEGECKAIFYSEYYAPTVEKIKEIGAPMDTYLYIPDFQKYIDEGEKLLADGYTEYKDVVVSPDDLATIVFTSGTTGKSKGVMLTHGNLASVVTSSCMCFQGGNSVGFLPLNHTFSWVATIFAAFIIITYGYICVDIKNLVKDFQTHHPQNFSGVPLVVETIYKRVWKTARKTGREEVLKKGIKISRFLMKFGIDVRRKLFAQVHEQLGGNLKYIIVGGAALDPEYEQGLYDLGIQVLNGYGITECSPAVTTNTMENHKSGSVGRPLPCNEIKINDPDEDGVGEIYVRGSNVMRGYYKDPAGSRPATTAESMRTASSSSSAARRILSLPTTVRTSLPRNLRTSFLSAATRSMRFSSARRATRSSQRFIPTTRTTARKRISSSRTLSTSSTATCLDGRTSTSSSSAPKSSRRPRLSRLEETTKSLKRRAKSDSFHQNNTKRELPTCAGGSF